MADPLNWPSELVPASEDWALRGGTRSGGQTFQGNEQVVASPTARWKATVRYLCVTKAQILALRRVIALGRSYSWYLGPYERPRAPWAKDPVLGGLITDRTPGAPQPAMSFTLSADAPVNSTQITITRAKGGSLLPGMLLTIGGRMHTIVALTSADPIDPTTGLAAPGNIGVLIRPWLRASYPAGSGIEMGAPFSVMRFASDDTGAADLQLSRTGSASIDFVEAF